MAMRAISHAMLLLASPVAGWVTRSQSVYGAQISEIQALMRGEAVSRNQQAQLGYLWYAPPDTNSSRGLGGGITWAWDDNLCDQLNGQMKEDVFFINLVTCNEYKAAVARAFDKWSANNRNIKFLDVSEECNVLGKNYGPPTGPRQEETKDFHGACPLAEIWITSFEDVATARRKLDGLTGPSAGFEKMRAASIGPDGMPMSPEEEDPNLPPLVSEFDEDHQTATSFAVATAYTHPRYAYDFRYSNGARPFYKNNPPPQGQYFRPVVEAYAGTFKFNTNPAQVCWYLDSAFCFHFHQLKASMGSASDAQLLVYGLTLGSMALGILFYLCLFCAICIRFTGDMVDEDGDGRHDDDEDGDGILSLGERCKGSLRQLSHYNPLLLTLFLMLFMIPPLITVKLFMPCFDCYDFEAAALHEIGHFLGLGHPDNIPTNWAYPAFAFAGPTPGNNSYHSGISSATLSDPVIRPNPAEFCANPWESVKAGVPPNVPDTLVSIGGNAYPSRESQMEAFTQNNPRPCLRGDDLEALQVLYPDCGATALFSAVCHRVNLNIGFVRVAAYVLVPTILALLGVITFNSIIHTFERREKDRLMGDLGKARRALAKGKKGKKPPASTSATSVSVAVNQ